MYVGFKSQLNYPFVVQHSLLSAQIFQYLPNVLKFPFSSDETKYENVSVKRLVPFTATGISYTITVAEVYFPTGSVNALSLLILSPQSLIYRNPDTTENSLASFIDSRIPLTGLDLGQGSTNSNLGSGSNVNNNGSLDTTGDKSVTGKGRIAGIAIGAAAGGGLYMCLMVLLFKRFKKGKAIELPPSDSESNVGMEESSGNTSGLSFIFNRINNDETPSPVGPENVQGHRGVQISDPLQASNSLGWAH